MNETYESTISFCVAIQADVKFWFDISGNKHVSVGAEWLGTVETSTIRQATKKLRSMMAAKRREDSLQGKLFEDERGEAKHE